VILLIPDFEALPLALLEAMATGILPVVRAIKSGISEVVHHESKGGAAGVMPCCWFPISACSNALWFC
jgi:glycosyltransferase involved in cell wall biosynthesis